MAGWWFKPENDFLGAGGGAVGARISLGSRCQCSHYLHSDQTFALHSHLLWPNILFRLWPLGDWEKGKRSGYISIRGYPWLFVGVGEGGTVLYQLRTVRTFREILYQISNFPSTPGTSYPKCWSLDFKGNKRQAFSNTYSDLNRPSSGEIY